MRGLRAALDLQIETLELIHCAPEGGPEDHPLVLSLKRTCEQKQKPYLAKCASWRRHPE